MKKRIITLLLALCLLCSMAAPAFAVSISGDSVGFYLVKHTVQSGDTLASVCTARGLSATNYQTITKKLNSMNSDALTVGATIWVPSTTANTAEEYYTCYAHMLVSGDRVYDLCNAYGISMANNTARILAVNNATTLDQFMAGTYVYIPVYHAASGTAGTTATATAPAAATTTTSTATTAATTTTATSTATTATTTAGAKQPLKGDNLAFYLVPYTMKANDTMAAVCTAKGVTFSDYSAVIKRCNNLTDFNALIAGVSYWVVSKSATGSNYYAVYAHKIVAGDTVYNLCTAYGVDMYVYEQVIKNVNNVNSLTAFSVGDTLYIPVSHGTTGSAAAAAGTGTTAAAATTATATATTTTTTTTATTTTGTTAATTATVTPTGDYLAFYLTKYTVAAGDTLSAILTSRGLTYYPYAEIARGANNLYSVNSLIAGLKYYIPSKTSSTGDYYKVYAHTVQPGDSVYNLCLGYGINMYNIEAMLKNINGVKNLAGFQAGQTIYIPVYVSSGTSATTAVGAVGAATTAVSGSTGTTATTNDGNVAVESNDLFDATTASSYYLVSYTVKSGDTLRSILNAQGSSYNKNANLLASVNNIGTSLTVGQKIWIPVNTSVSPSTPFYRVTKHTVVLGDSLYQLCTTAKANFDGTYAIAEKLNPSVNFNYLKIGQVITVPYYFPGT